MQKFQETSTTAKTSIREPIPGREQEMAPNAEGGYVFEIDPMAVLKRFLILGTEGGTFYASERELNKKNVPVILALIKTNGPLVVDTCVEISEEGRAARNDPTLFVHALASVEGNEATKQRAFATLSRVARTGTHLLHWVSYRNMLGGWGSGVRRAVGRWYFEKEPDKLAYQLLKYQNRDGWTHRDVLRLAHVKVDLFDKATQGMIDQVVFKQARDRHPMAEAVAKLHEDPTKVDLITKFDLTREMIPTELLKLPDTWDRMLPHLPYGAMIRNLRNMAKIGFLKPMSEASSEVARLITDQTRLARSRMHPLGLLKATTAYQAAEGHATDTKILHALEDAFYMSFGNIEPTGKRLMLALDVSGSMGHSVLPRSQITVAQAAVAVCMATARTELNYHIMGFNTQLQPLNITGRDRLNSAMTKAYGGTFGGTDCSAPMSYALKYRIEVDTFVIYTDSETHSYSGWGQKWAMHPSQALIQYRQAMHIDAKLVVVAMTSTGFTIADPKDPNMLDVVGFDTSTPQAISEFIRG